MIPVEQTVINSKRGDCFRACIASIMELDIKDVPIFHETHRKSLFDICNEWLAPQNLQLAFIKYGSMPLPKGYFIVSVASALFSNCSHAVVAVKDEIDGLPKIVWNPNPKDPRGLNIPITQISHFFIFALIEPKKHEVQP